MRRIRRLAFFAVAIVLVGIVALLLRSLDALGLFTDIQPLACRNGSVIRGAAGTTDMQFDAQTGLLFISARDRRGPGANDGIYVYRPDKPAALKRLAGTPANFHPSGISLVRDSDGSLTLMAINIAAGGNPDVDTFDVVDAKGTPALHERASITGGLLIDPFAIAGLDKDHFYVTNAHTTTTKLGRALDDYLLLPRADVLYFDGSSFRIVANHLLYASGIDRSPDGSTLYVAERLGREIDAYVRNPFSGDLTFSSSQPVASGLDNVDVGPDGELLVAGQPKLLALSAYARDPAKPSPSQIFRVAINASGHPARVSLLYSGPEISAAGVGVIAQGRLLMGSPFESSILSCDVAK